MRFLRHLRRLQRQSTTVGLSQSRHFHMVRSVCITQNIFFRIYETLSVRCAAVHRKIGTHVTKVYVMFIMRNLVRSNDNTTARVLLMITGQKNKLRLLLAILPVWLEFTRSPIGDENNRQREFQSAMEP